MNIDIRLSLGFFEHPKTLKLQKRCGVEAVLCLQRLWLWAAGNRSSGVLSGMDGEDIEIAAKWTGEEGQFVHTLIELRWLDWIPNDPEDDDSYSEGNYVLHGWEEHQAYASKSEERHERAKKAAQTRWEKQQAEQGQCSNDAKRCYENATSNATSKGENATSNAPGHQDSKNQVNTPPLPNGNTPPTGGDTGKKKTTRTKFVPPTVEEVRAYCEERNNGIDPALFVDHYAARGWKTKGGDKVHDWQACVRTWERYEDERKQTASTVPKAATVAQQRSLERQMMAQMLLDDRQRQREEVTYDAHGSRIVTQPDGSQLALPPGW